MRRKLTAAIFCRQVVGRCGSDGPLIPLLTEGGSNLIGKSCCEEKIEIVRGNIETRGKLTVTFFSMQLRSRGWWRWDPIPLVNRGRVRCAIDGITF